MKTRIQIFYQCLLSVSFCAIIVSGGCSKEEIDKMVTDAKEKAGDLTESANKAIDKTKQAAAAVVDKDGSGKIKLDEEISFSTSFLRLIPEDGPRPSILQIKSDRDGQEGFPAYLIQGAANVDTLSALSAKPVRCRVFVQKKKDGPVWTNSDSEPIVVIVEKKEDKYVVTFDGNVKDSVNSSQVNLSGTLESVEF